jgi:hypothetical protein
MASMKSYSVEAARMAAVFCGHLVPGPDHLLATFVRENESLVRKCQVLIELLRSHPELEPGLDVNAEMVYIQLDDVIITAPTVKDCERCGLSYQEAKDMIDVNAVA